MIRNISDKPEMTEDQERILTALGAAHTGVCCAMEHQEITPHEAECLLSVLLKRLEESFR